MTKENILATNSLASSESTATSSSTIHNAIPPLERDRSFWGMAITQFLGAFNDNLYKQLLLLLSVVAVTVDGAPAGDLQGVAMIVFAIPFLLFSGFAGYLSDLYSKRRIIVLSKLAEIIVMVLGLVAFITYGWFGLAGTMVVLFLMGAQSAFFGPGKYGILPEMLRPSDLPKANGVILMTTFVAIILGTAVAGFLKTIISDVQQLWMISGVCVLIAVAGTASSLIIRTIPPAQPHLRFDASSLAIPKEIGKLLIGDRQLSWALFASCMFWLVAGLVHMSVNALGLRQLKLTEAVTSFMVSSMAIGITIGCLLAGALSRDRFAAGILRRAIWGMLVCLLLLGLPGGAQLLGFWGSVPLLILLGMFAGLFAVPLQVFLQSRPPEGQKGRMIATMNIANWIAILLSGVIYFGAAGQLFGNKSLLELLNWNPNAMFALTAFMIAPLALFYRPKEKKLC